MEKFIYGIPKAELHMHLEGSLEPELKLQLAKENNIDIPQKTIEEVKESYEFNDLTSFLAVYYPGMEVLRKKNDFYRLGMNYFKQAKKHNVRYAELFFDPQAHTSRGVSFGEMFEGYYQATIDAKKEYDIDSKLIMCFLRDLSEESAFAHYEMAQPYLDRIAGFGLDSDERNNPPLKFERIFNKIQQDGFKITIHCDIDQEGSIHNIADVLHVLKADRIDHGTNIVENEDLVNEAIEKGIGFTCCPVSNGFVTEDMKGKEIKYLLRKGAKVTVNSDDPAYFQSYISDDMIALAKKENLSKEDIIQLARNSFEIAWITDEEKEQYLQEIENYI